MRRCRDCWHKQDYHLPELRKKIIYLDQFVISNLMKLKSLQPKGMPVWRLTRFGATCTTSCSNYASFR